MLHRQILMALALVVASAGWSHAHAAIILEFEFLDSGQTFAPTDTVIMQGRVTNTGDEDLIDALATGGVNLATGAPAIWANYVEFLGGGFRFGPAEPFTINAGASATFTVATWTPWPFGASIGDPVPLGSYVFPATAFSAITYTTIPFTQHSVDVSDAGAFVWNVTETGDPNGTSVPEPATTGLILLGTAAAGFVARRRS